ncbi:MAG: diguanylate cyclase [Solirubrobacterales bacterium]|nr:diguanylate cyclase [Solirubrobacterales bacterium]
MHRRAKQFRPFSATGRRTLVAIFLTFGVISALSLTLSIRATGRSQNRATLVEVAGRQRTLAERYVKEVLLVRAGEKANPALTASILAASAHALLDGGVAPAVDGDDDDTRLSAASGALVRHQLVEEQRLVGDLGAFGGALLAHRPLTSIRFSGGEHISSPDPLVHLRILGALTSVVALNVSRSIATQADANVNNLIVMQVVLGVVGLVVSLLLAWGLVAITRRQTAHFRSLVTSSSDLVLVLGADGCRYASRSLATMVGRPESELLGSGFEAFVHEDDRAQLAEAQRTGQPEAMMLRVRNAADEWRHLEAHVTDLRADRHLRGIVVNSRDVTKRVRLEHEVALQAQRDTFGGQLVEALEMADEETSAYDVVERAMVEISPGSPMELLLSDSSRAHLQRVATSPTSGAPACPVQSPFSCVAVRRGNPVVFETSEALNACPKLRGREGGACSAACVPISFMGRALGVLHATGPNGAPPTAEQVAQLTTLATQAGARIGTVRAFEKTQLQASTDGLTGLVNRRTFEGQVRGLVNQKRLFALAVADLDRFKAINDTHGHEAGDRALRLFAQVAHDSLREDDVLARWGGEEFVFALPGLDRLQAVRVLDRLRERLAQAQSGNAPRFTVSFGVTDSEAGEGLAQLLRIADSGLYVSKQTGRDRVTIGEVDLGTPLTASPPDDDDEDSAPASRTSTPRSRPLFHDAADEEDPRPSGLEIR